jgi:hypothetical protein
MKLLFFHASPAPNGSLLLNSRGTASTRYQSVSNDEGDTWSAPRAMDGFGSSSEGSLIRVSTIYRTHHV